MAARKAKTGLQKAQGSFARVASRIVTVAALFALQSLLGAFLPSHVPGSSAEAQVETQYCDSHQGDKTPAPDHRKSFHCCILCTSLGDRDAPLHHILASSPEFFSPQPNCAIRLTLRVFYVGLDGPPGWKSSWSSRAPPLVS
jgi:hypothetical protein